MCFCPRACISPLNCWSGYACCWSESAVPSAVPCSRRNCGLAPVDPTLLRASCNIEARMAFIEAQDLRKTYHVGKVEVPALRGVSFDVNKGDFVSIVGPSGSGKYTLFYLLGGVTRPDSGHIVVDGDDFAKMSDAERTAMRKRKIGFVFQKFNLLPTLDAKSNIEIA